MRWCLIPWTSRFVWNLHGVWYILVVARVTVSCQESVESWAGRKIVGKHNEMLPLHCMALLLDEYIRTEYE